MKKYDEEILSLASDLKQQYHAENKKTDWSEVEEILNEKGCEVTYDESFRCAVKAWEKNNGKLQQREEYRSAEIEGKLSEALEQKIELQKEKVKIQTEKIELNRWVREVSRIELFEEKIQEAIKNMKPINVPEVRTPYFNGVKKIAIGGFADIHYGKEFHLKDLRGEILNEYSPEIFEDRMWKLLDKYVSIINKESITELHLFNLGDVIDGMLRQSALIGLRYGTVDSTMRVAEFLSLWLAELSNHVCIVYRSANGNHSETRPLNSQKGDFPHENMERIINWHLKWRLADNKNIEFCESYGSFAYAEIEGYKLLAVHGQDENSLENSIKDYNLLYDEKIDILLSAHFHSNSTKTIGATKDHNIEYIQFPSICGTDDYAKSKKKNSKAGSKFIIIEGNEKISYEVILN